MALRFSNSSWVSFGKLCFLQKCPRKHFLICLHQVVYNIFLRFIFPFLKTITPELNFKFESVYLFCSRDSLSLSFFFTVYIVYPMFSFQFGILCFFHYFSLHRATYSNLLSVWLLQTTVLPWLCSYLGYY